MKVALLLTGHLRSWKITRSLVKNMLMDHYDCDIFMSINAENNFFGMNRNECFYSSDEEISEALDFFKPVDHYINKTQFKEHEFSQFRKNIDEKPAKVFVVPEDKETIISNFDNNITINKLFYGFHNYYVDNNQFNYLYEVASGQYFIIHKAYELLKNHISNTGKNYNIVIKLRFDNFFCQCTHEMKLVDFDFFKENAHSYLKYNMVHSLENKKRAEKNSINLKLDLNKYTNLKNNIYLPGFGSFDNYAYVPDQYWVHGSDLIDIMHSCYEKLPVIINHSKETCFPYRGCNQEHWLCKYLHENNVNMSVGFMVASMIRLDFSKNNFDLDFDDDI
jgi:hypothetical protein